MAVNCVDNGKRCCAEHWGQKQKASANMIRGGRTMEKESQAKALEARYLFFFFFAAFFFVAMRISSFLNLLP